MTSNADIIAKQRQHLWPNHPLYYTEPLPLERGEGLYVWDVDGNKYLDFFAGILTTSVGHQNPHVNARLREQLEKIIHTSTLYPNSTHATLAEKLSEITPDGMDTFYFGASGTDADETAVQLAQMHTGIMEVIALRNGYSGKSPMGQSLTAVGTWRTVGSHVAYVRHAIAPYCYRCPLRLKPETCGAACAYDIENVINTTTVGNRIAAFLAEPIQGVGGFVTPPAEYLKIASEIVHHYGGLVIIDEVQTGFGRTGTHWWGHQHSGIEPDIMTMAKGIANGMPLSAVATTQEIAASTKGKGITLSTFGGNPLSCAAAIGTLEAMQEPTANPQHCAEVGEHLRKGLLALQEKYPLIGDVRGRGLMQGVELVTDPESKTPAVKEAGQLADLTRKLGLLIGKGGALGNCVRIAPPLTATQNDVDKALEILDHAFARLLD